MFTAKIAVSLITVSTESGFGCSEVWLRTVPCSFPISFLCCWKRAFAHLPLVRCTSSIHHELPFQFLSSWTCISPNCRHFVLHLCFPLIQLLPNPNLLSEWYLLYYFTVTSYKDTPRILDVLPLLWNFLDTGEVCAEMLVRNSKCCVHIYKEF